jgi:hypothetical protein
VFESENAIMSNAKSSWSKWPMIGFTLVALAAFGVAMNGQAPAVRVSNSQITGLPDDWTHHHLIFSDPGTEQDAIQNGTHEQWMKIVNDPRYVLQQMKKNLPVRGPAATDVNYRAAWAAEATSGLRSQETSDRPGSFRGPLPRDPRFPFDPLTIEPASALKKDWSMDMNSGTKVGEDNSPAKYSFSVASPTSAANCAGGTSPDYVVYNTGVGGSTTQASIIAYDNLYTGTCTGTTPQIYWAYDTGGTISTSVVLSLDGTQVAFIHSASPAVLVLLKWKASTTETAASPYNVSTNGTTTNNVSNANYKSCTAPCMTTISFGTGNNDTISSPYYDYTNDAIYVGDAGGNLLKFTNVFLGATAPSLSWTLAGAGNKNITSPVCDAGCAHIYWTNYNSFLGETTPAGGTQTDSASTHYTSGNDIAETPIVDGTNGKVYLFAGGSSGSSCVGMGTVSPGGVGASGNAVAQYSTAFASNASPLMVDCFGAGSSTNRLYAGDFDNGFYTNGTGNLYVCGNTGADPVLYQIPITAGAMQAKVNTGPTITTGSAQCTPVTEVYNTAVASGPWDWIFLGVTNHGSPANCSGGGCIMSFIETQWQASTVYAVGQEILDTNLNIQKVTAVTGNDKSGAAHPTWNTTTGNTTADSNVTWTNEGNWLTNAGAAAYAGGTSAISIDNISATAGASNIYFSTLSNEACSGGTGGCAVQASQSAP